MTNANNPAAGRDRNGPTALLKSLASLDCSNIGGQVQYLKFDRELFQAHRPQLESLLAGYWALGGTQAMITVVGRGDLEAALRTPSQYAHLFVRVGGFCARFTDLPRAIQEEVAARTAY